MLYRYMLYTHFTIWAFVSANTRNSFCFRTLNAVLEREAELQADYAPRLSGWPSNQGYLRTTNSSFPRTWKSLFSIRKNIHSNPWHDWTFQVVTLQSWGCKFAPNHGLTVHSTNGLLVIFVLSLQGESLCHSDTNLNRLAPRFGTVLLVHVCFQNTEIPYSRCIWVHIEYEKSDHPRLRHCLTHIGTLKLIIFCWNLSSLYLRCFRQFVFQVAFESFRFGMETWGFI